MIKLAGQGETEQYLRYARVLLELIALVETRLVLIPFQILIRRFCSRLAQQLFPLWLLEVLQFYLLRWSFL